MLFQKEDFVQAEARLHHFCRSAVILYLRTRYQMHLDPESTSNAQLTAQFLKDHPEYYYILQVAHFSDGDVRIANLFHDTVIDKAKQRSVWGVVGDYRMRHDPTYSRKTERLGRIVGHNTQRVIQDYMRTPSGLVKYDYTDADVRANSKELTAWFGRMRRTHDGGKLITYQSAPESTRRKNTLRNFATDWPNPEELLKLFEQLSKPYGFLDPAVVQSIVMLFPGEKGVDWFPDRYNYGPVDVFVAPGMISTADQPITLEDIMTAMASMIPEDQSVLRGVWQARLADWPPDRIVTVNQRMR